MKNKVRLIFPLLIAFCLSGCSTSTTSEESKNESQKQSQESTESESQNDSTSEEDPFEIIPQDSWNIDDTNTIRYVRINSTAAGLNAASDTTKYNCGGTDLGFPWYDEDLKRLYVTFGDSFDQHMMKGGQNSNVTLYTDNFNFSNGVMWDGALTGSFGATRQITPVTKGIASRNGWTPSPEDICSPLTSTTIPTGGIVVNGVYYLFYMEVYQFNRVHTDPGVTRNGMWDTFNSRVVKSTDKGQTWSVCEKLVWKCHDSDFNCLNGEPFAQIHPLDIGDEYIYIYGIRGGRESGVSMGRVLKTKFEEYDEYEYYCGLDKTTGEPKYRKGDNGLSYINGKSSCLVINGKCGELSFAYNPYFGKYMVMYLSSQSQIVYRLMGENPYDWGRSVSIAGQGNIPNLYGGATHQVMFDSNNRRMFMFIAQWSSTIYSTHLVEVVFNKKGK